MQFFSGFDCSIKLLCYYTYISRKGFVIPQHQKSNHCLVPSRCCHSNRMRGVVTEIVRMCSVKKVLLEISQNSQENTCARDSFLIKFELQHGLAPPQIFFCECRVLQLLCHNVERAHDIKCS